MSAPIIRVENLGKSYFVGHRSAEREKYTALRDVLGRQIKTFARNATDMLRGKQIIQGDDIEEFWALDDISFDITPGEVVGVIGRNGAGKSTLLKVLSRITEPTRGRVKLGGRVASLLEVGTGFHPELTGRENIFLNGAILGMSRKEIKRKFDEIVDFAEVEKFLDTPVKRYSSGMYVRLAFAVAAHLEPEILVVDEVLAVGDFQFQSKCLGKMSEVASGGRTILFVSHNMGAVERLCSRGIFLSSGCVEFDGDVNDAISAYHSKIRSGIESLPDPNTREGTGKVRIASVHCPAVVEDLRNFEITFDFDGGETIGVIEIKASIYSAQGACVTHFATGLQDANLTIDGTWASVTLSVDSLPLNEGHYTLNASLSDGLSANEELYDRIENAAAFQVAPSDPFGTGKSPHVGSIVLPHRWTHRTP